MNNKKVGRPLKGNSKLETRMGFRIPNAMLKDVEAVCAERSLNKTDFILESIETKLAWWRVKKDMNELSTQPSKEMEEA